MNKSERIFRINIGFLINQPIGYNRDIPFEIGHYSFDEGRVVEDLRGEIVLSRTQNGLRLQAKFEASFDAECGRCLEEFKLPLDTNFEEMFTFENHPLSEDELIIPEDKYIDFEPYIRDYLMLELPINPVCKMDCLGLCDICGGNLNLHDCGHEHKRPDLTAFAQSLQTAVGNHYPGKNAPITK